MERKSFSSSWEGGGSDSCAARHCLLIGDWFGWSRQGCRHLFLIRFLMPGSLSLCTFGGLSWGLGAVCVGGAGGNLWEDAGWGSG